MSGTLLHQVLAVEHDKTGLSKKIILETGKLFKDKQDHFDGLSKNYVSFEEGAKDEIPPESKEVVTTVLEKLEYSKDAISKAIDVVMTKEETNSSGKAVAEFIVGHKSFGKYSATGYLALDKFLKEIRSMLEWIPTLDPTKVWSKETSTGRNLYETPKEVKYRSVKKQRVLTLAPATDKHPAQTQLVQEDVQVGLYETVFRSGRMTPGEKSAILAKIDDMILAAKEARGKANQAEVTQVKLGEEIFKYLLST